MRTLFVKLALALFVLLVVLGVVQFQLMRHTSALYQMEVSQKLNRDLARHIAGEYALIQKDTVNQDALKQLFHQLMVINPSIELYLLGTQGEVLAYSAPAGHVQRERVDLQAIETFLGKHARYPLFGDDPRDSTRRKAFSAAAIEEGGERVGYLYIILGSERYDTASARLSGSLILQTAAEWLTGIIAVTVLAATLLFAGLTRRLRRLSAHMQLYARQRTEAGRHNYTEYRKGDEIDQLTAQFIGMAGEIDEQVERLKHQDAARREMVANISHDLRTPLTTLQGYLETLQLKRQKLGEAERKQYLDVALGYCRQLSKLVSELFELAKLDAAEVMIYTEPFSLAELAHDVIQKLGLLADEKNIRLRADVASGVPLVYGDIGLMERVLENLIENALRHTPSGGTVTVGVVPGEDAVAVRVHDTGSGIEESELAHIFERFYQVDKSRSQRSRGAGLGLAIVRRILELHGSVIRVDSRVDQGTTFSFSLGLRP